jgi:hypothetical protein
MILGMTPFTLFHVILSLIGIVAGFIGLKAWLTGRLRPGWTAIFLVTTIATTLTGFLFPFTVFTPAIGFGIISAVFLAVAVFALYRRHLAGRWRLAFLLSAAVALYLNTFVLIVQAFQKIGPLNAFAPTGTEAPFAVAQGLLLLAFILFGYRLSRRTTLSLA